MLKKQSCPLHLNTIEVSKKAIKKLNWVIDSLNATQEPNYLCELRTDFVVSGIYDIVLLYLAVEEFGKHFCNQT